MTDELSTLDEIQILKKMLSDTDYKIIKSVEGYIIPDIEEIKIQRKAWRDRINELEGN